jgi:hypothetical protein
MMGQGKLLSYPDDAATASELYKSADKSMYAHKRGLSVA